MNNVTAIECKIRELVDQARFELSGNPVHIDTLALSELAGEIDTLQQTIWDIEMKENGQ